MKKFQATAIYLIALENLPRLNGPGVYSGLFSYKHLPRTGKIYEIWPARVLPEKNAWKAVSEPMEMAPNAVEMRKTARDALLGVCVRLSTLLSQLEKGRALSREYAKKIRLAATN